jgi:hypothetical protein
MSNTASRPLAVSQHGEPLELPEASKEWRVRRLPAPGKQGAPEMVYGADGLPLLLSIDATPDDLAEAVDHKAGKYRLDAVDGARKTVPDVGPAYVVVGGGAVREPEVPDERGAERIARYMADSLRTMTSEFGQSMRVMTEQAAVMMDAASRLVAAADSADITRRDPPAPSTALVPAPSEPPVEAQPAANASTITAAIVQGLAQSIGKEGLPIILASVPVLIRSVVEAFRAAPVAPRPTAPVESPASHPAREVVS